MWYGTTSGELDDLLKICHLDISINLPLKSVGKIKTCISYIFFFYFFMAIHITWCKLTLSFILTYNEQPHHIQSVKTAKSLINYENNKQIKKWLIESIRKQLRYQDLIVKTLSIEVHQDWIQSSLLPEKLLFAILIFSCRAWSESMIRNLCCFHWAGATDSEVHGCHSNQELRGQNGREMEGWKSIQAFCIQSLKRHLPIPELDMPRVKGQKQQRKTATEKNNKEKRLLRKTKKQKNYTKVLAVSEF